MDHMSFICFLAHSLLRTVCAAAYTRESLRLDSHPPRDSVLNSLAIFAIQGGIGSLLFIVERFGCKAAMTQVLSAPCAMIHHSAIFVRRKTQIGTCLADKDAPAICFSAPSLKDNLGVVVIAVALVFCLLVVDPRH